MSIAKEIAALQGMTPKDLRRRHLEVFGEATRSGNRQQMVKRIAWRLQAQAEGGLSERARRRAAQLARDADIRTTTPKTDPTTSHRTVSRAFSASADERVPPAGSVITRDYKQRQLMVLVLPDGSFEFEGVRFKSLSAVAKEATGTHVGGYAFFGLRGNK